MAIAEVSELRIENLDHLGIIAGVIDRINVVERINARLGTSPDEIITSGQVLKAMILNGLGFVSAPLYLFSSFLIDHMINDACRIGKKSLLAILLDINTTSVNILKKFGFEQWGYFPDIIELRDRKCGQLVYGLKI